MASGWSCPACGRAHSPDTVTCPNKPPVFPLSPTTIPFTPPVIDYYYPCPTCGKYGAHICITYSKVN